MSSEPETPTVEDPIANVHATDEHFKLAYWLLMKENSDYRDEAYVNSFDYAPSGINIVDTLDGRYCRSMDLQSMQSNRTPTYKHRLDLFKEVRSNFANYDAKYTNFFKMHLRLHYGKSNANLNKHQNDDIKVLKVLMKLNDEISDFNFPETKPQDEADPDSTATEFYAEVTGVDYATGERIKVQTTTTTDPKHEEETDDENQP